VPVPTNSQGQIPQVQDGSTGAVTAQVFDLILMRKARQAAEIAVQEATSVPDSSGESKKAGFGELKAPRLANVASELEQAQNVALHFLEMRWGNELPTGSVAWPRDFSIEDIIASIEDFFNLEKLSGYKSPTLGGRLMVSAAKEKGFIVDDADGSKIEAEYMQAATDAQNAEKQRQALELTFMQGGSGGPPAGGSGDTTPAGSGASNGSGASAGSGGTFGGA
jgi:hypothetical protein